MDDGTAPGGPASRFPHTRHSVMLSLRSPDPETRRDAFGRLVRAYWKPIYKYLRLRWRTPEEDARDLTQAFLARALEKGFFDQYDSSKARFRTFLRVCLDGFVANELKSAGRIKRGGGVEVVPLDFPDAEGELRHRDLPQGTDIDEYFRQEWIRGLFGQAVDGLRASCAASGKEIPFALFERHDLSPSEAGARPSYKQLAGEFGLTVTQVTNFLAFARREFRRRVLEELRVLCGSEEEFREEARSLLGVDSL